MKVSGVSLICFVLLLSVVTSSGISIILVIKLKLKRINIDLNVNILLGKKLQMCA